MEGTAITLASIFLSWLSVTAMAAPPPPTAAPAAAAHRPGPLPPLGKHRKRPRAPASGSSSRFRPTVTTLPSRGGGAGAASRAQRAALRRSAGPSAGSPGLSPAGRCTDSGWQPLPCLQTPRTDAAPQQDCVDRKHRVSENAL